MNTAAKLVLANDRRRVAPLDATQPLTIGRAASNRLCLASSEGVSDHHAVVRHSRSHGWVVCNWHSQDGTWLEGQRVHQCRALNDGDEIRLGQRGPVLVFELQSPTAAATPQSTAAKSSESGASIDFGNHSLALTTIRSAAVRSEPQHPHIFSWWLLLCLGGLLLLPFPLLFWPLQITALAGSIVLGSHKNHTLVVELRDGLALSHRFDNRRTALAHRNGIRKAIGQAADQA